MNNHQPTKKSSLDQLQPTVATKHQFGIVALFWTTFLVGLGIAYLQRLNSQEILIGGGIAIGLAVVIGFLIGVITKRLPDAVFWATLVAAFAYISVATDPNYDQLHRIVWAIVGALTGAIASTVFTNRPTVNAVINSLAALICFGIYWLVTRNSSVDFAIDLFVAPVIGVAVTIFVRMLMWLESQKNMPRYVTATWLLIVVILANYFSR